MPSIYTPLSLDGFEFCHPIDEGDFETIHRLVNGEPRQASWKPLAMRLIKEYEGKLLKPSDSPWLGEHALVFKKPAIDMLGPELQKHGEMLPLECHDTELFMFNPTRVIDSLDEEASSVIYFNSGRIMDINRYVFRGAAIQTADAFKIPNLRVSPTFFSRRLVQLWKESGLEGLGFTEAWTSQ